MRKDIQPPKVEGVAMAVVREKDEEGIDAWYVYLINRSDAVLENVLVSSRGYGELEGEERRTSEMRHHLERLGPSSWARIEHIVEDVFPLTNQYWLSFYIGSSSRPSGPARARAAGTSGSSRKPKRASTL